MERPAVVRIRANPTEADLEAAYAQGLLRKEALVHGSYYQGHCRNASVARWSAPTECFVHWRSKWGQRFIETIKHPADERVFDVFTATGVIEPMPDQVIDDAHLLPQQ